MPRYFFHVHDGADRPDSDGIMLDGPDQAWTGAVETFGVMPRESANGLPPNTVWTMNATDEGGQALFTLQFSSTKPVA